MPVTDERASCSKVDKQTKRCCTNKERFPHLDFLFVLELSFADDDVLDSGSVSELFLENGVSFEKFFGETLVNSIDRVFVNHSSPFVLQHSKYLIKSNTDQ